MSYSPDFPGPVGKLARKLGSGITLVAGLAAGAFHAGSCSSVDDRQITPSAVPEETIALVKTRLPDAAQVIFSPLIPGKVWLAQGYVSGMHHLVASRTDILAHFKDAGKPVSPAMQQVIDRSAFGGGIVAQGRKSEMQQSGYEEYQADYSLYGQRYLISWKEIGGNPVKYEINVHPRAYRQFVTEHFDDLAPKMQALASPGENFRYATVTEEGNGAVFQLEFENGILEVDDDLDVLFSSIGAQPQEIREDEIPEGITGWLEENPVSSLFTNSICYRFAFGGTEGYKLIYYNETEQESIYFDKFGKMKYYFFTTNPVL